MADEIVLRDGFDAYNGLDGATGLQSQWTIDVYNNMSMTPGRFGGQALRCRMDGYNRQYSVSKAASAAVGTFALGFAFRPSAVNYTLDTNIGSHVTLLDGSGFQLGLRFRSDGSIEFGRVTAANAMTVLGASVPGLLLAADWNYFELESLISDSTGTGRVYLNGDPTPVIDVSNIDNKNTANATIDGIMLGPTNANATAGAYLDFDDLYLKNTDSRLGPRKIETLYLSGNGAHQDFTPSAGADNAALLDESQVDATDYVTGSTVGQYDEYVLAALSGVPDAISEVNLMGWMMSTDVATRAMALGIDSGGTVDNGSDHYLSNALRKYDAPRALDPNTGLAWTAAGVNALIPRPIITV